MESDAIPIAGQGGKPCRALVQTQADREFGWAPLG